ncbi:hypothetical protein CC117_09735 [Parafrankia colletiae]|uniref:Uncharacterized protein n=1 Tax=Parafrankia colletiae TaxID=573497 RepID=A0A1S1RE66_9ACTN|nr:hypothetical protein [Frankia sp. Cpl3]OHV44973.1 hypothetical protein CC117_09735 [Parafrankia colletiae]
MRAARLRHPSTLTPGDPLTRQELAERVNRWIYEQDQTITEIDANYIGKLERGMIRWPQHRYREALRAILRAETDHELGFRRPARHQEAPKDREEIGLRTEGVEEDPVHRRGFLQLGPALIVTPHQGHTRPEPAVTPATVTFLPNGNSRSEPISVDVLRAQVSSMRHAYQSCRYAELDAALPALLAALDSAEAPAGGITSIESLRAHAYQVAASVELKRGNEGPAWLAADRSMRAAIRSGNPLDIASSARVVTHALMRARQFTEAATVASTEAARFSRSWERPTPAAFSVYGALLLRGAVAAAQADNRAEAATLLDEAAEAARWVDRDGNEQWTAFGPTNIALHRVHVAVVLGDAGMALEHARTVNPQAVPVTERRAALHIDIARAHSQRGSYGQATQAIVDAERIAPEELARRPASHRLIRHILTNATGSAQRTVHDVAVRSGIAA